MYSVDSLKVILFRDEVENYLELIDATYQDEEFLHVKEYLNKRIEELKKLINDDCTK